MPPQRQYAFNNYRRSFGFTDVLAAVNRDFPPSLAQKVQLHAEGGLKKNLEEADLKKRGEIFGAFKQLLDDARSNEMKSIFAQKLGVNLRKAFTRITLRGYCDPCQGKIHTDAKIKLVSWLIYLEEEPLKGDHAAGNLRLLTGPELKDTVEIVPSSQGTLLVFKNSMLPKHGWHGFYPYTGPRRAIQVNYQTELPEKMGGSAKKKGRRRMLPEGSVMSPFRATWLSHHRDALRTSATTTMVTRCWTDWELYESHVRTLLSA
eukprot:4157920-Pyramimonas_sp.AAC.1